MSEEERDLEPAEQEVTPEVATENKATDTESVVAETPVDSEVSEEGGKKKLLLILIGIFGALLLITLAIFGWYLATHKPISQLPGLSQSNPPSFSKAIYDVSQPLGVAVDEKNGRLYATQTSGKREVLVFNLDSNQVIESLKAPEPKKAHVPVYVAVDPTTSNVYVTDRGSTALYVYDSSGKYLSTFKPKGVKNWTPLGVAFDSTGNLYVSDVTGKVHVVYMLSTDGTVLRTLGKDDGMSFPNGIAVDSKNRVYVADSNHGRVIVYGPDGKLIGAVSRGMNDTSLGIPRGLAIDDNGMLYVVDTSNQLVQVFKPSGNDSPLPVAAYSFGQEGSQDGAFEYPNGIATDSHGRVYVTDRENNRVQVWSY